MSSPGRPSSGTRCEGGRNPLIIGLTGGIASGKSTVAKCFEELGVPVVDADRVARELVHPGSPALDAIVAEFGSDVLEPSSGELDRTRMRQRVFTDPAARQRLEAILHPRIREEIARRIKALDHAYCVQCVPLLVETGQACAMDRVVVVDVPTRTQVERTMARDGVDIETVKGILAAQASREQRLAVADDVIDNSGDLDTLRERVFALHRQYLAMAKSRAACSQNLPVAEQK